MAEIYNTTHPAINDGLYSVIKSSIDAAETIQLCAQHQKSIVDDVSMYRFSKAWEYHYSDQAIRFKSTSNSLSLHVTNGRF